MKQSVAYLAHNFGVVTDPTSHDGYHVLETWSATGLTHMGLAQFCEVTLAGGGLFKEFLLLFWCEKQLVPRTC